MCLDHKWSIQIVLVDIVVSKLKIASNCSISLHLIRNMLVIVSIINDTRTHIALFSIIDLVLRSKITFDVG